MRLLERSHVLIDVAQLARYQCQTVANECCRSLRNTFLIGLSIVLIAGDQRVDDILGATRVAIHLADSDNRRVLVSKSYIDVGQACGSCDAGFADADLVSLLILIVIECGFDDNATDRRVDCIAQVCLDGTCGSGLIDAHTCEIGQRDGAIGSDCQCESEAIGLVVIDDRHFDRADAVEAARAQSDFIRVANIEAKTTSNVVAQFVRIEDNQLIINALAGVDTGHIAKCNQIRVTAFT